ncbi:aa3-type cytochrome oxidase subunit CtaJ [Antrihabitans cavernicola]|uniref:Uncharacterized protein n=1 Tax=Antrihabitans cavernicola TaxID=2495913 RepID=A0A5A7SCI4_9NOCA|nr:hypothetical protein [Spelaeibacter cavernicola]KAA0022892.1 hypothetical protein FOY51_10290 [Spelaeibacter cavernicola]
MSILETVLIFVLIPVVVIAFVGAIAMRGKPVAGTRPAHFDLGSRWTHAPMLFSATDEITVSGHHGGGHAAIEAGSADLIGGRAHGRW